MPYRPPPLPGIALTRLFKEAAPEVEAGPACRSMAFEMNRRGPADCRENVELIVRDILPRARQLAAKRHPWAVAAFGRLGIARPDSDGRGDLLTAARLRAGGVRPGGARAVGGRRDALSDNGHRTGIFRVREYQTSLRARRHRVHRAVRAGECVSPIPRPRTPPNPVANPLRLLQKLQHYSVRCCAKLEPAQIRMLLSSKLFFGESLDSDGLKVIFRPFHFLLLALPATR